MLNSEYPQKEVKKEANFALKVVLNCHSTKYCDKIYGRHKNLILPSILIFVKTYKSFMLTT